MRQWIADSTGDAWLYCVREVGTAAPCKLGIATHIAKRLSSLQGGNHRRLEYVWMIRATRATAAGVEFSMLARFRPRERLMSEWIALDADFLFQYATQFFEPLTEVSQ